MKLNLSEVLEEYRNHSSDTSSFIEKGLLEQLEIIQEAQALGAECGLNKTATQRIINAKQAIKNLLSKKHEFITGSHALASDEEVEEFIAQGL